MKTGRPKKWPEGRAMIPVEAGKDQVAEIDVARGLLMVNVAKGGTRPMNRAEFAREALRLQTHQLKTGTFQRPTWERPFEAELDEMRPWPEEAACADPAK